MALPAQKKEKDDTKALREDLAQRIRDAHPNDGLLEIFPGVYLARTTGPTKPFHSVYSPCFCVIARGSKTVKVGDESFTYDEGHYLIATMDLPTSSCIVEASEDDPYLSIRVDLDPTLVAEVLLESGIDAEAPSNAKAMNVSAIDVDLLDASLRLIKLLDTPADAKFMLPLLKRELIYRLLKGNQASRLAHLISNGDLGSIILFGSVLAWAVYDRISLKHRADAGAPPIPVGGIGNDLIAVAVGVVAYLALALAFHPLVIGVPVVGV